MLLWGDNVFLFHNDKLDIELINILSFAYDSLYRGVNWLNVEKKW